MRRWAFPACLAVMTLASPAAAGEAPPMRVVVDSAGAVVDVFEGGRAVLRYNYGIVAPPDGLLEAVSAANRKYAVARADYIHPLYGPDGEVLTRDWAVDHPHHRGVYWAWPEVDWNGRRGDLHALQHVLARPAGELTARGGRETAVIEAASRWVWETGETVVRERVRITAHRQRGGGRAIDLRLEFAASNAPVAIARRHTDAYGGLNIRLAPVADLEMVVYTDPDGVKPRMAWADAVGRRSGGRGPCGLAVLPCAADPQYPDDWVQYPQLPWIQPAFPRAGVRYVIQPGRPLVLRRRLWIHRGGQCDERVYREQWRSLNSGGGQ